MCIMNCVGQIVLKHCFYILTFFSIIACFVCFSFLLLRKHENIKHGFSKKSITFAVKRFIDMSLKNKKKVAWVIMGQILFAVFFIWFFSNNSYLRPSLNSVKEYCIALMLLAAMAINFWFFFFFQNPRRSLYQYVLFTTVELLLITFIEYIFTVDVKLAVFSYASQSVDINKLKYNFFANLLIRNCGLFCFVGLVSNNINLKIQLRAKDKILFQKNHQIEVQQIFDKSTILLNENDIRYIRQQQNYCYFITASGIKYVRRDTLNDIRRILGNKNYVQISRNTIVRIPCIKSCCDNEIVLFMENNEAETKLKVSPVWKDTAVPIIEEFLQHQTTQKQERFEDCYKKSDDMQLEISLKSNAIFQYIVEHTNCKLNDIVKGTNIPKSTVTRYLKELQKQNLIEYVGSKKTGGYRAVERSGETIAASR